MLVNAITTDQAQRIDSLAMHGFGMSSIVMMENAGRGAALLIAPSIKKPKSMMICVVCGSGNNGGDGLVIARYLLNLGFNVKVFLVGQPARFKEDVKTNYRILKKMKVRVSPLSRATPSFLSAVHQADIIVDALFGIGVNRDIQEPFLSIIQAINRSGRKVFSVDVPSGLDATTGKQRGACVKAKATITFVLPKKGFFCNEGPGCCGRIYVVDIGIPSLAIQKILS
jgi:ADP-dependent NAD(P)H-hydrate dehydratase / NAD(P)H-hydrate epimerase